MAATIQNIKQLQHALNALGFECGKADGIIGRRTGPAIEKCKEKYGISANVSVEEMLEILRPEIEASLENQIADNDFSSPDEIVEAQSALHFLGENPGPVDGIKGPLTNDAIDIFKGNAYRVKAGDTLSKIAEQYKNQGLSWQDLAKYNGIDDPTKLQAGKSINIPPLEEIAALKEGRSSTPKPMDSVPAQKGRSVDTRDNIPDGEKPIYLTFDDGPHKDHTPKILEALERAGAKATFFVRGDLLETKAHREIVQDIYDAGHELAVHTNKDHTYYRDQSSGEIIADLNEVAQRIKGITGEYPKLSRAAGGWLGTRARHAVAQTRLSNVDWHNDPSDHKSSSEEIIKNLFEGPYKVKFDEAGQIILLHDIHQQTVDALPEILTRLAQEGYSFDTLSSNEAVKNAGPYDVIGDPGAIERKEAKENIKDAESASERSRDASYQEQALKAAVQTIAYHPPSHVPKRPTIGLDAGHGSFIRNGTLVYDPGAVRPHPVTGEPVHEAKINIEIAQKLEQELYDRGFNVVMTRSHEHDVLPNAFAHRRDKAYNEGGVMQVSLHANTAVRDDGKDDERAEGMRFYVREGLDQNSPSKRFAEVLHQADGENPHAYRERPLEVGLLRKSHIDRKEFFPMALAEVGFMSNPDELLDMLSEDGQDRIVAKLADGIEIYYRELSRKKGLPPLDPNLKPHHHPNIRYVSNDGDQVTASSNAEPAELGVLHASLPSLMASVEPRERS